MTLYMYVIQEVVENRYGTRMAVEWKQTSRLKISWNYNGAGVKVDF